jgi:Helix-turn-helix domain
VTAGGQPARSAPNLERLGEEFGELVDSRQAADVLGVAVRTLETWRHQGMGPPFVRLGPAANSRVRYPLAQLREFLARGLVWADRPGAPPEDPPPTHPPSPAAEPPAEDRPPTDERSQQP